MSRFWNETIAAFGDLVPGGVPVLLLLLFLLTGLVSVLWYSWPAWLPWRWSWRFRGSRSRADKADRRRRFGWPRLGRLRFRWRWPWRRRNRPVTVTPALPDDELPDLPASTFALNADQLAAAGRYAEAVRERLRAIVRDLVERQVLAPVPGWTVTELAAAAGRARPATAGPLRAASELFSDIWYGQRPATADDDRAMRELAEQVRTILDVPVVGVTR
ncbi:DUF4129 domain-containing protein [Micromonospora echinofusca]|uniref:DUF4129 domain-containing protein n=1 Tax=Micromonospora echinofusca TaxID=47858 RepID=A0ABS3VM82_MICEH|nr:DUF4129 domain-containing protein [Micromonospora echinofusca]MBO4205645.1 DUF4129 domain-containing protein [Micromonospora echinofusca]